jgi:hypothetical protein
MRKNEKNQAFSAKNRSFLSIIDVFKHFLRQATIILPVEIVSSLRRQLSCSYLLDL